MTPAEHLETIDPAQLVELHGDALFCYAMVRVGRREVAEDLVQDTFVSALQSLRSFEGRASYRTWLIKILKNKIVDHARAVLRDNGVEQSMHEPDTAIDKTFDIFGLWGAWTKAWRESPEGVLENIQLRTVIGNCLSKLPYQLKMIFTLRALDEMPAEEVRQQLSISPECQWTAFYRARMKLQSCLNLHWFELGKTRHRVEKETGEDER